MKIGFIGLGLMGIPMARNIITKGGDLSVWNRTRSRTRELEELGATVYDDARSLAASVDVLITMVTRGEDVDDILFGPLGIADGLKAGSVVIDMSTIGVEWAETIGAKLSTRGVHFYDAPVTGSTPKAITGELTIFVGGDSDIYQKIMPVLALMGTNLRYMGAIGTGQAMKLVNNTLVAYTMIGLAEAMKLGSTMGLDKGQLAEVIQSLPVSSPYVSMKIENFATDTYPMMFSLENMAKDLSLAHAEMEKYGLSLEMLEVAHSQYQRGLTEGIGDLDVSAIEKVTQ